MKFILTSDTHYGFNEKTESKHVKFWNKLNNVILKENVDIFIWAGDLISNKQSQFEKTIKMARENIKIPILLVKGNHDLWDYGVMRPIEILNQLHNEIFQKYNIHHLEKSPYIFDDVIICGFDGWYGSNNPPTNDKYNINQFVQGCETNIYLSNNAFKKFDLLLDIDLNKYKKSICVTHHAPYITDIKYKEMCANLKFYDIIKERFDVLCCGHNHKYRNDKDGKLQILNCGSDYNNPKYILFEI